MPSARKRQMSRRTVIFFDYDDTLLPSTFLASRGLRLDTTDTAALKEVEGQLKEVETAVTSVLTKALAFGEVCFVTNAETGWVQLSAQKFMPGLVPFLDKVDVVSARSTFEPSYPDSPLKWKFFAFHRRLCSEGKSDHINVLSFGDSHVEREAVIAVTREMPNALCKSIKFAERPSTEQLRQQIELITNCFHYIHLHDGHLDLQLTVTANNADLAIQAAGGAGGEADSNNSGNGNGDGGEEEGAGAGAGDDSSDATMSADSVQDSSTSASSSSSSCSSSSSSSASPLSSAPPPSSSDAMVVDETSSASSELSTSPTPAPLLLPSPTPQQSCAREDRDTSSSMDLSSDTPAPAEEVEVA